MPILLGPVHEDAPQDALIGGRDAAFTIPASPTCSGGLVCTHTMGVPAGHADETIPSAAGEEVSRPRISWDTSLANVLGRLGRSLAAHAKRRGKQRLGLIATAVVAALSTTTSGSRGPGACRSLSARPSLEAVQ